jgi:hypothetical protein
MSKTAMLAFAAAALLATSAYAEPPPPQAPGDANFGTCVKVGIVTPGKNGSLQAPGAPSPPNGPGFFGPEAPFEGAPRGTADKVVALPFDGVVGCGPVGGGKPD